MSERDTLAVPSFQKTKAKSSFLAMTLKSLAMLLFLFVIFLGIYWGFGRVAFEQLSRTDLYGQVMRGQVDVRRMAALEWATKLQMAESRSEPVVISEYLPTEDEVVVLAQELESLEASARPDKELIAGILGVLGHSNSLRAQEALRAFLLKPRQTEWAKAQVQAIIGLSRRQPDDSQTLEIFKVLVNGSVDASVRKSIAYALGFSGEGDMDTETWTIKSALLEVLLRDHVPDVRWNAMFAALRLQMSLGAANEQLVDMLAELGADVSEVHPSTERQMSWLQKRETYLEALNLTQKIERSDPLFERVHVHINKISQGHPDLKIRQAGKNALKFKE